jgi:hypothetical protein
MLRLKHKLNYNWAITLRQTTAFTNSGWFLRGNG